MLAGLAFCEMLSQYPQSAFHGVLRAPLGGLEQFATQTLRVHLLGLEIQGAAALLRDIRGLGRVGIPDFLLNCRYPI